MARTSSPWRALAFLCAAVHLAAAAQQDNVCPYDGGWSLRVTSSYCPSSAPIDCGTGTQRRCCPSGYVCAGVGLQGGSWCCKEGEDCLAEAREFPRCPNQQWTLWGGNTGTVADGAWCCQPGFNGFYKGKAGGVGGVGCTDAGVNTLPSDTYFAKTVSTTQCVTSTPTPSSSSSSSSSVSATATPTGSAADGQNAGETSPKEDSQGLGTGAIVGIVVGCVGGIALIAGIIGVMMWRRRKNRATATQDMHNSPDGYAPSAYGQQPATAMGYGAADGSVSGYSGSTPGGYFAPSKGQQQDLEPQMKENTVYTPPVELHHENRHLMGDQRAESHEMP
ncbi:hypothetical protein PG996_011960 [Apiospora saccharicola]|uniref:Mid2 domain-containing protein n=1 Tax=Apiospora saccharicola TaxID=335842 RepID=A0ABR1U176_9PEZI